ncbi:MAG TPA: DUF2851 family protein [Ktedonobacterales bacterium]|nr:DUF2851 family protein [Ktedonobacterales bacterium]
MASRGCEAELAARWSAGIWRGATLQGASGETYRVVFEGRRGGGAGPDFRDAVLVRANGDHVYGDIELHLRPAGWHAHGHASDPRYNGLALHVVLTRSTRDPTETPLASGRAVPLVVLGDEPTSMLPLSAPSIWPCTGCAADGRNPTVAHVLREAGMARLAEHTAHLERDLRMAAVTGEEWDAPNRVLWLALAEALGYGRDRAALRQLAQSLLDDSPRTVDELSLPSVERLRARGLLVWHARWHRAGPWAAIESALRAGYSRDAVLALVAALRVPDRGAVSPGRAAIVAVNVALPYAAAIATLQNDAPLAHRVREVYLAWPGLPSNQIVREMASTLGLARLPRGAMAQQGLHHLWQHACREKRCQRCPLS